MRAHFIAVPPTSTHNGAHSRPVLEIYLGNDDDSRLLKQIASEATLPYSGQYKNAEYYGVASSTIGTSRYVAGETTVTADDSLPGRSMSGSSVTAESIATREGEQELDQMQRLLEPDPNQDGALTANPHMIEAKPLECLLKTIFDCQLLFNVNDEDSWIDHCFWHLKTVDGKIVSPPQFNRCHFCDREFEEDTGKEAWRAMLQHIRKAHYLNGHRSATARPAFGLVYYLWQVGVIGRDTYRDWTAPNLNSSSPSSPDIESPPVSNVTEGKGRNRPRLSLRRLRM